MKRRGRPASGKHQMPCPFCGRRVFVEFTATDATAHHKAPVCPKFKAKAESFGATGVVTPGAAVRGKFES